MSIAAKANTIFRFGYGAFFALVGLYGSFSLLSGAGNPFSVEPGAGAAFQEALDETGFIVPVMLACYVVGGFALMFARTAPAGIVILAPFVVVIFFYHVSLGGSVTWAIFWLAGLLYLAYVFRAQLGVLVGLPLEKRFDR